MNSRPPRIVVLFVMALAAGVTPAAAQLNTQHIKGLVGLKGGSLPPEHWYFIAPLIYVYNTDTIRNADGNKLPVNASINSFAYAGGAMRVTSKKILGGDYAFQILFPVGANNLLQGDRIDENPGPGLSDSAIVPIQLGWHGTRADAMASYLLYIPTGRYTDGASDNTGYGMWGQEVSAGTTVYLTPSRQLHAATTISFTFQSKKEDSETQVGSAMNLEGGIGADFLQGGLTAGLSYYYSGKLTQDVIDGLPTFLQPGKGKVFGLGPEGTLVIAKNRTIYAFVKVNYFWETYARITTQGQAFAITLTLPFRPIALPPAK